MKVFWSWQSDSPGKIGRHFIRKSLEDAITQLKEAADIEEPESRESLAELHLDQDRQGVSGSPDLARLILDKIKRSAVVVADVTPVGAAWNIQEEQEKKLINPNVAIEVGYALAMLGDEAFLMVMNENYGTRNDLPFDLRAKAGPITFSLRPDASKEEIIAASKDLTASLKNALRVFVRTQTDIKAKQEPFPAAKPAEGQARFRLSSSPLGDEWNMPPFGSKADKPVFLASGSSMWLRLMPPAAVKRKWSVLDLKAAALDKGSFDLMPFNHDNFGYVKAEDGFGVYSSLSSSYSDDEEDDHTWASEAASVAFAFETGEVWSIDTFTVGEQSHGKIYLMSIIKLFSERLTDYTRYLGDLGLKPPFEWIAGLEGVKGYRLQVPPPPHRMNLHPGESCVADIVLARGIFDGVQNPTNALSAFVEEIFSKCTTKVPEHIKEMLSGGKSNAGPLK